MSDSGLQGNRAVLRCWFTALLLALITVTPSALADDAVTAVVDQIDVNIFRHYMEDLLFTHDGDSRTPNSQQHDLARDNIEATLASFGLETYLDPFQFQEQTYYNVVAVHPGLVTPERHYIISGHFDTLAGTPGADDNASACAGVMEIARVLSQYDFESTLIFITFDIEEPAPHFIGSRHYIAEHNNDFILGMVSMDLIAFNSGTNTCTIYGRTQSNPIKNRLAAAVENYSNGLTANIRGQLDRSDHAPFEWANKLACWLIETDGLEQNPCYHRACDSVDNPNYIDYDYAIQIVRGLAGYLVEQAALLTTRADLTDFEIITGSPMAGDLSSLKKSDDTYVHTRSGFGQSLVDLHNMEMIVSAVTTVDSASTIDMTIESRIDEPAGTASISLKNFNSGDFDSVGSYSIGNSDQVDVISNLDATNYVDGSGNIELSIKQLVFVPFLAFTFESFVDHVEIVVE